MASRCMACGTDLDQELVTLRAALKATQFLAHEAWEHIAIASVATGKPRDEAIRSALDALSKARGNVTAIEVDTASENENLRREVEQLKHRLSQFTRVSKAAR